MDQILVALRAAGEATRLRIIGLLGHGELTVSELVEILRQSQPRVSRHLKLLCEAGLLDRFREGTWVFYRISESPRHYAFLETLIASLDPLDPDFSKDIERLRQVRSEQATRASHYFNENAPHWDKIRSLYVPDAEVEAELLSQISIESCDGVLDIGTGTGRMLELVSPLCKRAIGLDISREMLTVARANLEAKGLTNCQARQGNMYDLPVDNSSQDLVIFHQVLHYSNDPAMAVREAARALKTGGQILVVDFAPHELEFLREEHAHRRLGFADKEVQKWAKGGGLEVVHTTNMAAKKLTVKIWRLVKQPIS